MAHSVHRTLGRYVIQFVHITDKTLIALLTLLTFTCYACMIHFVVFFFFKVCLMCANQSRGALCQWRRCELQPLRSGILAEKGRPARRSCSHRKFTDNGCDFIMSETKAMGKKAWKSGLGVLLLMVTIHLSSCQAAIQAIWPG